MSDILIPDVLEGFFNSPYDFEYLLDKDKEYYSNRLHRLDSNLINNLAKALVAYYHREYYMALEKIIRINDDNWQEYHFYNKRLLDDYLDCLENELQVFSLTDLKIFVSILDIAFLFLKNATDESDFESTLNSFFQFKDKCESNNFTKNNNRDVVIDKTDHQYKKVFITIGGR